MKKWIKWLSIPIVLIIILIGIVFYRRDSRGNFFKAQINHSKVMMNADWYATVKLTANHGATYQVLNNKNKIIQGTHSTTDGKAAIRLQHPGSYIIIAKSDNGHVKKKLPVKVSHYQKTLNRETTAVEPLKFKITSVDYRELRKNDKNKPDDSLVDEAYSQLNKHYYQVKVNYLVQNTGNKAVSPQYTIWLPESDDNQEFSTQEPTPDGMASDTIIGTSAISPKSSRGGSVTMISNNKFSVKHFKFSIDEVLGNNGKHISKGGIARMK